MKLTTAIDEFLIAQEADGSSEKTIVWYRSLLKVFATFMQQYGDLTLEQVSTQHIRKYLIYVRGKYSTDTASAHSRSQHKFWKWCGLEYDIKNPMRNIRYPKRPKPKEPKAIATANITRLFNATEDDIMGLRDKLILAFLADTGARAAGICGITVDNIDLEKRQVIVTEKGNESRIIPFSAFTAELTKKWLDVRYPVEPLFYNFTTLKPLTVSGLQQLLKRLKKKAGVTGRVNPHAFRHGFAREYLKNGGDLATLGRLLGHKDISTTANSYAIFTIDEIAEMHDEYSQIRHLLDKEDGR